MKKILTSVLSSECTEKQLNIFVHDKELDLHNLYTAKLLASSKGIEIVGKNLFFLWFLCASTNSGKMIFSVLSIEQELQQWIHAMQPEEQMNTIPWNIPTLTEIIEFLETTPTLFGTFQKEVPFYFDLEKQLILPQRIFWMYKEIFQEIKIRNRDKDKLINITEWEKIYSFLKDNKDPSIKIEDKEILVCKSLLQHNVTIITGGPGTGKTTCMFLGLISLLYEEKSIKTIFLLAPTGRAAVRLNESLSHCIHKSSIELQKLATTAKIEYSTIHTFLKISHRSGSKYSSSSPVEADVIVVDESSMLTTGILHQLLSSTPTKTKIIFIGDPFQLPPVQESNVMWDLLEVLREENSNYFVTLEKQRRSQSQIQQLSSHLRSFKKDPKIASKFFEDLRSNEAKQIFYMNEIPNMKKILDILRVEFQLETLVSLAKDLNPYSLEKKHLFVLEQMFTILQGFSFLQATKNTPLGSVPVNKNCLLWLRYYADKIVYPVCVIKNEHDLEMYNGDRGLYLEYKNQPEKNVVIFLNHTQKQKYQFFSPSLLRLEPAFSQTVHKSQGSEFKKVTLFLEQETPITTRSLLYTAVTRAKESFCLFSEENTLQSTIENIPNNEISLFRIVKDFKN